MPLPDLRPAEPAIAASESPLPASPPAEDGEAPLELTEKLPTVLESPYLTRARASAQVRQAPAKERHKKRDDELQRPGRIARMAICSMGILVLGGVWVANRESSPAITTQPAAQLVETAAAEPPVAAAVQPAPSPADALARYQNAAQLMDQGRGAESMEQLRAAAEAGYAPAQYRLAKAFEHGDGVEADLAAARQWSERAASNGNVRAMHDLGVYFARGDGGMRDEAAAFRWFRQAAEFGVPDSQYNLGVLYQQGRGVSPNAGEALFWYFVAERQGDAQAGRRAHALMRELPPIQVEQARARAQAFTARPASAIANDPPPTPASPAVAPAAQPG